MRFHSIQKSYHRIITRAPINRREYFRDFQSERKEREGGGKLMNFKKIENRKELRVS